MTYFLDLGAVGVFLVLWLTGFIVSKAEHGRAEKRAGEWRRLYETEVAAHRDTRAALERERERSDAGLEAGRTVAAMLSVLNHQLPHGGVP
jgi:hypothetical protein